MMARRQSMDASEQGVADATEVPQQCMQMCSSRSSCELTDCGTDGRLHAHAAQCGFSCPVAVASAEAGSLLTGLMRLPSISSGDVSDGTESPIAWSSVTAALQGGAWPPFAAYQSTDGEEQQLHESWHQHIQQPLQEQVQAELPAEPRLGLDRRWAWQRQAASSASSGMHTPCTPMVRMGSPCLSQHELPLVDWSCDASTSTTSMPQQAARQASNLDHRGHVTYTVHVGPDAPLHATYTVQASALAPVCPTAAGAGAVENLSPIAHGSCVEQAGGEDDEMLLLQEIDNERGRQMVDQGVQTSSVLSPSMLAGRAGQGGHGYGSLLRAAHTPIRIGVTVGQQPPGSWSSTPRYPPVFLRAPVTITGAATSDGTAAAGQQVGSSGSWLQPQHTAPWSHGQLTHVCAGTSIPLEPQLSSSRATTGRLGSPSTQVQQVQTRLVDPVEGELDTLMQDVMDWVVGPGAELALPHPIPGLNSNEETTTQTPRAVEPASAASPDAGLPLDMEASTPDLQEAGRPPISRLASLLLRGMHRSRHAGVAPAPETPVTPTLAGMGAADHPPMLISSVVSHARIRQLLSTRQWANDPEEGNPLRGLQIPSWAARFAPSRPAALPSIFDATAAAAAQPLASNASDVAVTASPTAPAPLLSALESDHSLYSQQHPLPLLPVASIGITSPSQAATPTTAAATAAAAAAAGGGGAVASVAPVTSAAEQSRPRFAALLASYLQRRADQQLHAHIAAAGVTAPYADTAANVLRPPNSDAGGTSTFINPPQHHHNTQLSPSGIMVHAAVAPTAGAAQLRSPSSAHISPLRSDSPGWDTASLLPLPPLPTTVVSFSTRSTATTPELRLAHSRGNGSTTGLHIQDDGRSSHADNTAAVPHIAPLSAPILPRLLVGSMGHSDSEMSVTPVYHEGPATAPAATAAAVARRLMFLSDDRTAAMTYEQHGSAVMGQPVHTSDVVLRLSPAAASPSVAAATTTAAAAAAGSQQITAGSCAVDGMSTARSAAACALLQRFKQDAGVLDELQHWMKQQGVCWQAPCIQAMLAWLQEL